MIKEPIKEEILKYNQLAQQIRLLTLDIIHRAKASHIGGAFSMSDILAVLYGGIMNIDPNHPTSDERDRFLLSKGHACASLYATLAIKGFFPVKDLETYTKDGSYFTAHTNHKINGVEISTGSLGHAFSVGCGLALAAKRKKKAWTTYVLLSDGELNEGSNWEAFLFAPHHGLNNLTVIIDYNKIQSFGNVKDVLDLDPLRDKLESFRWDVIEVDGHDTSELEQAFLKKSTKPKAIIAHTVKGKGIDFMEHKLIWHYKPPNEEQYEIGKKQLKET